MTEAVTGDYSVGSTASDRTACDRCIWAVLDKHSSVQTIEVAVVTAVRIACFRDCRGVDRNSIRGSDQKRTLIGSRTVISLSWLRISRTYFNSSGVINICTASTAKSPAGRITASAVSVRRSIRSFTIRLSTVRRITGAVTVIQALFLSWLCCCFGSYLGIWWCIWGCGFIRTASWKTYTKRKSN